MVRAFLFGVILVTGISPLVGIRGVSVTSSVRSYAAYLHAPTTKGWDRPRAEWLSLIGFIAIIFNLFFKGLHVYSGI